MIGDLFTRINGQITAMGYIFLGRSSMSVLIERLKIAPLFYGIDCAYFDDQVVMELIIVMNKRKYQRCGTQGNLCSL